MVYYRFQHEKPQVNEEVHCYTTYAGFREFVNMMKGEDPDFHRMKFWEITGRYIRDDEGDAVIRVASAKQIFL